MVLPAIPLAVWGLIRLITWLSAIVLTGSYIRDILTKTPESDIQASQDDTIENILNEPNITDDQKVQLILEYLKLQKDKDGTNWVALAGLGAVLLLGLEYLKKEG